MSAGRLTGSALLAAALALSVAACGGRTGTTSAPATTLPPATTAPTTSPPTTPPPSTPAPATTLPPTTFASEVEAVVQGLAGEWSGEWANATFGSTGPVSAILEVFGDGTVALTIDLGGMVFGQGDPAEERFLLSLDDLLQPVTVQSATFGEVVAILSPDGARVTAGMVPADGVANFQLDLAFDVGPRLAGTYFVGFDDGSVAEGTVAMEPLGT